MSRPPARPLTRSERDWLAVRSYLTEHRYDLAVDAAEDYPPGRRMAGTPLLAASGWQPSAPIPLRDISLELSDADPQTPAEAGLHAPFLPRRADGTRYRRYSDVMGELAAPLVFENRATYRLTDADLGARVPRLAFTGGRYFDGIDTGEAAAHEYAAARLGLPAPGLHPAGLHPARAAPGWPARPFRRPVRPAAPPGQPGHQHADPAAGPEGGPGLLPAALAGPGQGGPRRRPVPGHPGGRVPAFRRSALESAA